MPRNGPQPAEGELERSVTTDTGRHHRKRIHGHG